MKLNLLSYCFRTLFVLMFSSTSFIGFSQTAPDLGTAGHFALFTSNGAVGNTGSSDVTGDIGTNTGDVTGFGTSVVNGAIYTPGAATAQTATDLMAAYNAIFNTAATNTGHTPSFGAGETLNAGVYSQPAAASVGGTLILDGQGNSNAIFIFKIGGAFTTAASTTITLINGAVQGNIFWIAEGAISMAAATKMEGTLIAHNAAISMAAGGTLHGRMFSTNGAVAIDTSIVLSGPAANVGGTVAANQTICPGTQPANLILTGNTGAVIRWQKATNTAFTSPTDIVNTSNTLTGAQIGYIAVTTYFRAKIDSGTGSTVNSSYVTVNINTTTSPNFGAAASFVLFTSSGAMDNIATSKITGDVGSNAGAISGFGSPNVITGTIHSADALTAQAATDLLAAYNNLFSRVTTNSTHAPEFGAGETLNAGIYAVAAAGSVAGNLILDGQGNPDALFIFKIGAAFTTGANTKVTLINGAFAGNVFWIAEGAIAMGVSTTMEGTLIAHNAAVSMSTGGVLHGRLFSTSGAFAVDALDALSVADDVSGSVSSNQTICFNTSPANLNLSGNTKGVIKWQKASDALFTSPIDISNTSTTLTGTTIGSLNATTYFRAVVTIGICGAAYSNYAVVTVIPIVGGTVSPEQNICYGTQPSDIVLSGNIGNVLKWQKASDAGFTSPTDINVNTAILPGVTIGNIIVTTYFRAVVQNSSCTVNSTTAIINIKSTTWDGLTWSNSIPTATTTALITGDFTAAGNFSACTLTISNNAVVTIPSGYDVTLNGALSVISGSFTLENNANLLQLTNAANSGNIIVKRNSSALFRLDYTMWSSPVTGIQTVENFSPLTSSTRFYTYNTTQDLYNSVVSSSNFGLAKGYLIRTPNNWVSYIAPVPPALTTAAIPASWTGTFIGVPNNGNLVFNMSNAGNGYNAVGNPYPSALNLDAFIVGNSANIEGTLWFWRKTNDSTNANSYYTCSTVGCNPVNDHIYLDEDRISTGQGFIVKAKAGRSTLNFTNSTMRSSANVNQFFRTASTNRYWLALKNSSNVSFGQELIAYVPEATLGYDSGLDGLFINDNPTALLSMADDKEVVIQARPTFDVQDIVPLLFKTNTANAYTISLVKMDGIFSGNQDIFLKDNLTGTVNNLKSGSYTFASETGNFSTRFEILYQNTLGTGDPIFNENAVAIYTQGKNIVINSGTAIMENVKVFDIRGSLLIEKSKINASELRFNAGSTNQVLIVKITSDKNETVTKKVVN